MSSWVDRIARWIARLCLFTLCWGVSKTMRNRNGPTVNIQFTNSRTINYKFRGRLNNTSFFFPWSLPYSNHTLRLSVWTLIDWKSANQILSSPTTSRNKMLEKLNLNILESFQLVNINIFCTLKKKLRMRSILPVKNSCGESLVVDMKAENDRLLKRPKAMTVNKLGRESSQKCIKC